MGGRAACHVRPRMSNSASGPCGVRWPCESISKSMRPGPACEEHARIESRRLRLDVPADLGLQLNVPGRIGTPRALLDHELLEFDALRRSRERERDVRELPWRAERKVARCGESRWVAFHVQFAMRGQLLRDPLLGKRHIAPAHDRGRRRTACDRGECPQLACRRPRPLGSINVSASIFTTSSLRCARRRLDAQALAVQRHESGDVDARDVS